MEPIAPMPENSPPRILPAAEKLPQRQSHPQLADARPARAANEEFVRPMRMPVAPTDPRVFSRSDLPLPPTMSDSGMLPSTVRPRLNTAVSGDNGGRRLPPQKVFENYRAAPTQSPYALLNASTDNGTINPYMAYVRPQQEQQANQSERGRTTRGTCPINLPPATRRSSRTTVRTIRGGRVSVRQGLLRPTSALSSQ